MGDTSVIPTDVGARDSTSDLDGDGFVAPADCDETDAFINPMAFDVPGDGRDNDCDGTIDNPSRCDTAALMGEAISLAAAMDLCRHDASAQSWGLLSAALVRADGSAPIPGQAVQHAVMPRFGPVLPRGGTSLVVLSSGTARLPGDPEWISPRIGAFHMEANEVPFPPGQPVAGDCPAPMRPTANDSIGLRLKLRAPSNARSFSFDANFYTSEYNEWVCSPFNDAFVALFTAQGSADIPKNIALDPLGRAISVNSSFFEVCTPSTAAGRVFPCTRGVAELRDTGFWDFDPTQNGATSWLTVSAPILPNSVFTLDLIIWDTTDHGLDSSVLLDAFRWSTASVTRAETFRPR